MTQNIHAQRIRKIKKKNPISQNEILEPKYSTIIAMMCNVKVQFLLHFFLNFFFSNNDLTWVKILVFEPFNSKIRH